MSNENLDIVNILDHWFRSKLDNIHTIIPGEIVEYEGHQKRKAKVQPLIRQRTVKNKLQEIQPIDNVPVVFPSSGDFSMVFPLNKGDGVLLLFSESPMGNYLNSDRIQDADDLNRFDLTDCIAIPGLWSFYNTPTKPENDTDLFINFQDSSIQIKDKTNDIIIVDKNNNKIEMSNTGIKLTDKNNNVVEMGTGKVTINGNFEVLQ